MYTNDEGVHTESSHLHLLTATKVTAATVSKAEHSSKPASPSGGGRIDIFTSTPTDSVMLLHDSINVKKIVTMMLGQQRLLRSSLLFRLSSQQQQLFQYRTMFGSKKIPPPAVMGDER